MGRRVALAGALMRSGGTIEVKLQCFSTPVAHSERMVARIVYHAGVPAQENSQLGAKLWLGPAIGCEAHCDTITFQS